MWLMVNKVFKNIYEENMMKNKVLCALALAGMLGLSGCTPNLSNVNEAMDMFHQQETNEEWHTAPPSASPDGSLDAEYNPFWIEHLRTDFVDGKAYVHMRIHNDSIDYDIVTASKFMITPPFPVEDPIYVGVTTSGRIAGRVNSRSSIDDVFVILPDTIGYPIFPQVYLYLRANNGVPYDLHLSFIETELSLPD
jgi:hypothetical protein